MVEQDEWVFFKDIDWQDPLNNRFNIDTRDFHCGCLNNLESHKNYNTLKNYARFFFTEEEMKAELERLYVESGGEKKWRLLNLVSNDFRVKNWNLKYIRIWRTELGFLICNSKKEAMARRLLSSPVDKSFSR